MFSFLFANIKSIGAGLLGLFMFYVMGKNSKLSKQNDSLNKTALEQSKNIEVKKEVINALREIKDLDINGNVERMRMYNKKSKSKNRTL
jgi:hypothetical protein